ncbi:1161_t:CDS:2, partial [Entrophospora sp. SA101]
NNITKSNIRNNSNSNIKISKSNNKSTTTTPKIEKETIIPFSNYLGLTGQPPTEKFDVADHYWTNLPLEAILPSKSKYKNTKNKKNSSFTPSSINLNLFTKYELDNLDDYINYENSEVNAELELQNIMNEYYKGSITIEDYINCDNTYEIESMPGLEEIIAVGLNKEEEEEA